MKKKKRRRGISAGTWITLAMLVAVLGLSSFVFTRLMGQEAAISLNPGVVSETLTEIIREIGGTGGEEAEQTPEPTAIATPTQSSAIQIASLQAPLETEAPTLYMNSELSIVATGQVSLGAELRNSGKQATDLYDYSTIFSPIAGAAGGADLSIVTLRSTLDDGSSGYDDYCAPATLATALKEAGFNLINLGTDRILDHGLNGLAITRNVLEQRSLSSAGAYLSQQEADTRSVVTISDVKIGLLSYTMSLSGVGQNASSEEERAFAVRLYDAEKAAQDIAALREEGAQIVIVLAHWGKRGDTEPSKTTLEQADELVQAGADIILGTGPTNVHAMEKRQTEDGRTVFIAYSLGNFLIDDSRETDDITGVILRLNLEWDSRQERLLFADSWYMPTWIMRLREDNTSRYSIVPAGSSVTPEGMTDSIYVNMKKSYQSMTERLGSEAASPKAE